MNAHNTIPIDTNDREPNIVMISDKNSSNNTHIIANNQSAIGSIHPSDGRYGDSQQQLFERERLIRMQSPPLPLQQGQPQSSYIAVNPSATVSPFTTPTLSMIPTDHFQIRNRSSSASSENAPPPSGIPDNIKIYKVWPGTHHPICGGRVLVGPMYGMLLFHLTLIFAISFLFLYFVAFKLHFGTAIPFFCIVVSAVIFLLRASLSDPGFLPRVSMLKQHIYESTLPLPNPPYQTIYIKDNPQPVTLKFCTTCRIYRPYLASHCRDCDLCVESFDHHCPWIANCVGKRNYPYFLAFIFSMTTGVLYIFVVSIIFFAKEVRNSTFAQAVGDNSVSFALIIASALIGCCLLPLSIYHIALLQEGLTTYARIKGTSVGDPVTNNSNPNINARPQGRSGYEDVDAPHPESLFRACDRFFCRKPSPSLLDLRLPKNEQPFQYQWLPFVQSDESLSRV